MFYPWDITIPAGTTEAAPIEQKLILTAGIIKNVHIKFPAGCHGMVKVRLFRWGFQLIPLTDGEWVTGDDETVPTETYYELTESPFFLMFKGCSPDTTYDHKISVRIEIEPALKESDLQVIEKLNEISQSLEPSEAKTNA